MRSRRDCRRPPARAAGRCARRSARPAAPGPSVAPAPFDSHRYPLTARRADASAAVTAELPRTHAAEHAAGRTAEPYEVWRRQRMVQVAAAWLLSCVFVRVLEDRGLLARHRLAGPGAEDSQRQFGELAPYLGPRDYLLTLFRELAKLPATAPLFDARHHLVCRLAPSQGGAQALLDLLRAPQPDAPAFRFGQPDTRFTCREPEWGENHCMIPHIVYLANSSGLKVGITRYHQVPTRWIDQGAIQALPVFEVPSRRISGFIALALAKFVSDRTHWQKMLKNHTTILNLQEEFDTLKPVVLEALKPVYDQFGEASVKYLPNAIETKISYPVLTYPQKIQALNIDKQIEISGKLLGIKGQYLILDTGVLNIRKFTGYHVCVF